MWGRCKFKLLMRRIRRHQRRVALGHSSVAPLLDKSHQRVSLAKRCPVGPSSGGYIVAADPCGPLQTPADPCRLHRANQPSPARRDSNETDEVLLGRLVSCINISASDFNKLNPDIVSQLKSVTTFLLNNNDTTKLNR